jgi:hypothetical protein
MRSLGFREGNFRPPSLEGFADTCVDLVRPPSEIYEHKFTEGCCPYIYSIWQLLFVDVDTMISQVVINRMGPNTRT